MIEIVVLLVIVGAVIVIEDCIKDEFWLLLFIELVIMVIDVREFIKGLKLFVREMLGILKFWGGNIGVVFKGVILVIGVWWCCE